MEAYCVKCREKVEIKNSTEVVLKNGQEAIRGECPNCGLKVFCFVKKKPETTA